MIRAFSVADEVSWATLVDGNRPILLKNSVLGDVRKTLVLLRRADRFMLGALPAHTDSAT